MKAAQSGKNSAGQAPTKPMSAPALSVSTPAGSPAAEGQKPGTKPAAASKSKVEGLHFDKDVAMPDLTAGDPAEIWDKFFKTYRPAPQVLATWVGKLHAEKQYKQVVACLQAALIHGQAQPWMYEVLALSMELEGAPKTEVERVLLSLSDFGGADYSTMMYSGAYLTRFGRKSAALKLYQQASRGFPERPEPYTLGLKLARELNQPDDVEWAVSGILLHSWGPDYATQHRDAENALREQIRLARNKGDSQIATRLEEALASAKSCDLKIRLDWNGAADLDMQVEEPGGMICSVESPQTPGGGIFLHDGVGPDTKNAYEFYVCPRGVPGPYRVTVKNSGGKLVGGRATLTVTMLEGTKDQTRMVRTLVLDSENDVGIFVDLPIGRRERPRAVGMLTAPLDLTVPSPDRAGRNSLSRRVTPDVIRARNELEESQANRERQLRRAGAIGYVPVIQVVHEGPASTSQVVVSHDRRYVKIGLQPHFNQLVDSFNFTYLNGR